MLNKTNNSKYTQEKDLMQYCSATRTMLRIVYIIILIYRCDLWIIWNACLHKFTQRKIKNPAQFLIMLIKLLLEKNIVW